MRNHGKTFSLLMSVCFIVATATAAFAQSGKCSFQKLSFPPPATNGTPVALNDLGGIAGFFIDSKNESHGFLLFQGRLTTFKFPGSSSTTVSDMSRNGIIVGDFSVAGDPREHHYMVHAGGFHEITLPGHPNADFTVTGVNSNGDIVGAINSQTLPANGYVLHNGKLTFLLVPGSDVTLPTSINDEGVVVGGSLTQLVNENPAFIWKDGVFSNISPPGNDGFVNAAKVSNSGVVVGFYESFDGTHGFALDNGTYTKIDGPGFVQATIIQAVNKFDNILVQTQQSTQQGINTVQFKGFCAAAF
ncbi:MAG TPA: hypothetical protein VKV30_13290 [Candidatus Angelobacter sp.]|nr:hypothetical protein [Candidatus Angelobacter sp.]